MSLFFSPGSDSLARQFYCRKDKSLGVLCANFLRLYNRDGVDSIGLDAAAMKLGVERRRIYDVVNILEGVGVVARKQKNQYSWKGFEAIPHALEALMEEGLRENFSVSVSCSSAKVTSGNENEGCSSSKMDGDDNSSATQKSELKREKSLLLLTQNFVKLFLCLDVDMITLDSAAISLFGDASSSAMRTKVRRLYDIANVFSSMNLIEKTHHSDSRKPGFRWLGWRGNNGSQTSLDRKESKKRSFGTEITNHNTKRQNVNSSIDWNSHQKENVPVLSRCSDLVNDRNENKSKHHAEQNLRSFQFGPFTPVSVPAMNDCGNKTVNRIQDLESLASTYFPRYQNQALSELFGHYVEAWKSWHVEVGVKEKIQKRC